MIPKFLKEVLIGMFFLIFILNLNSALVVDADYVTLFPGEQGNVRVNVENNENFDIEDVSLVLDLNNVPFTSVGSSEKDVDDIDEDDSDSVTFSIRPSTGIIPGDYSIPFSVKYTNAENNSEIFEKEGNFGIRVSAKTDLDFSLEIRDLAIVGEEGRISVEVVNKGLGEVKSVSVQIFPSGFELLSKDKVFVGSVSSDDTDIASFDVIYKSRSPILSARIDYKDFDNIDKVENINIPFKVYTQEEALGLGLIKKDNTSLYIIVFVVLIVLWLIWRKIKKVRKERARERR